jgi:hypothetical protein
MCALSFGDNEMIPSNLIRSRDVFERHLFGETYKAIAGEMGISVSRARQLDNRWRLELRNRLQPYSRCPVCGQFIDNKEISDFLAINESTD